MLSKLARRNARRSARDYLVYIVTMGLAAALMYAFDGMLFSDTLQALYGDWEEFIFFIIMIALASVFIVMIVVWLVHYIIRFMLRRRSREFGTYLLMGMTKKQIVKLFRRENLLLGGLSLVMGLLPGAFFQVAFTNLFYALLEQDYQLTLEISGWGVLITWGVMGLAYWLALFRTRRELRRMTIRDLLYMDRQNERMGLERRHWKTVFVILAVGYIVLFNILVLTGAITLVSVWGYVAGLIAAIYLLYAGLSSLFVRYIDRRGRGVYAGANLFVLRQLAAKVRTMRFTMGTLTILFTAALLGWTVVMMFAGYQLSVDIPMDVYLFSDRPDDDFAEQLAIIEAESAIAEQHIYTIYEGGGDQVNQYLYRTVPHFGEEWNTEAEVGEEAAYFGYDTYIGLGDYNRVRVLSGYDPVTLSDGAYLVHCKARIADDLTAFLDGYTLTAGGAELAFGGAMTESFAQNGINGADYLLVVPDYVLDGLTPYFSVLAANLESAPPEDLADRLSATMPYYDDYGTPNFRIQYGSGTDQIISWSDTVLVRDNMLQSRGAILLTMCFALGYIGVVFILAALTILAVQQLADSTRYRFRYDILRNLGLDRRGVDRAIFQQLSAYYLCPFVISLLISGFIGLYAGDRFVYWTGVEGGVIGYYAVAALIFGALYLAYFAATFVGFSRNVSERGAGR